MADMDEGEAATINQLQFDEMQKRMGKPTSKELKVQEMLKQVRIQVFVFDRFLVLEFINFYRKFKIFFVDFPKFSFSRIVRIIRIYQMNWSIKT